MASEEIGMIFIFQSLVLITVNIVAVGSMSVMQPIYFRAPEQLSNYLASSMANSMTIWVGLCVFIYFLGGYFSSLLGIPFVAVVLAVLVSFAAALQGLYQSLLHIMGQPASYFRLLFIVNIVGLATSLILIVWVAPNSYSRIAGLSIAILVGSLIACRYFRQVVKNSPNISRMKELIGLGAPVIIHSSAMLMIAQTDKLLIANLLSLTLVGEYGVASQFASVMSILAGGLSMAYLPVLYKRLAMPKRNDAGLAKSLFMKCIFVLGLVLTLYIPIAHYFVPLILGPLFFFQWTSFVILSAAGTVFGVYHFFSGYFYYYKHTKVLASLTLGVAATNFVLSYYFIPIYGINGAAVGTLISYAVALLFAAVFSYRYRSLTGEPS